MDDGTGRESWIEDYEGLSLQEVRDLAHGQARLVRTVRPGEPITLDLRPDRLNIALDENGELDHVWAG